MRSPDPDPPVTPLTRDGLDDAVAVLTADDDDLAAIVRTHGPPPLWARRPGFATLVHVILGQQVSTASADAAYRRLSGGIGRVTPRAVLARTPAQLNGLGLTRQKTRYCRALAREIVDGRLDLRALATATNDDVIAALTRVPGIGRWTADVYLLMALRRADVWPRGDLALYASMRDAIAPTRRLRAADPRRLDTYADRWRPWRAVAARLLWHDYLRRRGR